MAAARVRFGLLVAMFQAMSQDRTAGKKRGRLRAFLDRVYGESGRDDYFSALRLIIPGLDRERASYGLKEAALAAVLVVLTGILGSVIVTPLMNALKIRDYAARGFAVGVASHGIGTARAFQVSEEAGTFAGIAMGLNGALTALVFLVVPFLL